MVNARRFMRTTMALTTAFVAGCQAIFGITAFDVSGDASASFCARLAPPPVFCSDFDEDAGFSGWNFPASAGGATVAIDTSVAASPPASMRVVVPPEAPGQGAYAGVSKTFDARFTKARVSFMYFAAANTGDNIVQLSWASPSSGTYFAALSVDARSATIYEQIPTAVGDPNHYGPAFAVTTSGAWIPIELAIDLSNPGAPLATATVGDVVQSKPLAPPSPPTVLTISVGGIYVQNAPAGWSASFDNVVVRFE